MKLELSFIFQLLIEVPAQSSPHSASGMSWYLTAQMEVFSETRALNAMDSEVNRIGSSIFVYGMIPFIAIFNLFSILDFGHRD
jgi:pilus assembly protein TadC